MSNWPNFTKKEIDEVKKILKYGKVNYTNGIYGKKFEAKFAKFHKLKYCIAVSNGTLALELVLKALNLKKNDEVIVTSKSFIASASCVLLADAKPVFSDVDLDSQNMTLDNIKSKITKRTKVVICVHLGGWPCEMKKISLFCKKNNIIIIEDCSQAHGAKIDNKYVGTFGDFSTWSFCNDKIISTGGEGGMISTKTKKNRDIIWSLKDHGKKYNKFYKNNHNKSSFSYIHDSLGTNGRLTEVQSSIGIIQLDLLNKRLNIRKKNAERYIQKLKVIKALIIPKPNSKIVHSYYRLYLRINFSNIIKKYNKNFILKNLNDLGFECFEGSCSEIYLEKCFSNVVSQPDKRFKNAKYLSETSFCVKVDHTINFKKIDEQSKIAINFFKYISKP